MDSLFDTTVFFLGFVGTRYFIIKFYDDNKDLMENTLFTAMLVFSVFYSYFKDVTTAAVLTIVYRLFFYKAVVTNTDTLVKPFIT